MIEDLSGTGALRLGQELLSQLAGCTARTRNDSEYPEIDKPHPPSHEPIVPPALHAGRRISGVLLVASGVLASFD